MRSSFAFRRLVRPSIAALALGATLAVAGPTSVPPEEADVIPTFRKEPDFPREAIISGTPGWVIVEGTIAADGTVAEVRVKKSHPPGLYDAASLRAVKQWRFKPKLVDGVAVPRAFEQRLEFNIELDAKSQTFGEPLVRFVKDDLAQAKAYQGSLRGLCPDRYPRAEDAPNLALGALAADASKWPVEPSADAYGLIFQIRGLGNCLFSSWEQFKDADAWAVIARYAEFEPRSPSSRRSLAESVEALRSVRTGAREPGAKGASAADLLPARAWIFARVAPAYHELTQAHARSMEPAPPLGSRAREVIEQYRALEQKGDAWSANRLLRKALKEDLPSADRAQLMLALARMQVIGDDLRDARATLEAAQALPDVPWNLAMAAETARAHVCAKLEDPACFDAALAKLNRELALDDRLAF